MAGEKKDQGKRRYSLLPFGTLNEVVDVLEFGAGKYSEDNWQTVEDADRRYYDATLRHLDAYWRGEAVDKESGHYRLAHAICCLLFLLWFEMKGG